MAINETAEQLNLYRHQLESLKNRDSYNPTFYIWQKQTRELLVRIWGEGSDELLRFDDVPVKPAQDNSLQEESSGSSYRAALASFVSVIDDARFLAEKGLLPHLPAIIQPTENPIHKIVFICDNFHTFAKQLETRRADKEPVLVTDEYDVQYLLHALLRLFFDKVRAEDWTPQYAGKSSRMDFVVEMSKNEKIIIEAKKTRPSLGEKEVGSQLLDDIFRYKQRTDCKTLICFVYDPEQRIRSPRTLESDLNEVNEGLNVIVLVRP